MSWMHRLLNFLEIPFLGAVTVASIYGACFGLYWLMSYTQTTFWIAVFIIICGVGVCAKERMT